MAFALDGRQVRGRITPRARPLHPPSDNPINNALPMPMLHLYDKLLTLPLFQGLSHNDLSQIVEQIPFEFKAFKEQDVIVKEDTPCSNMVFLLDGVVETTAWSDDRQYSLKEQLKAPNVLQPERIFGLTQRYTRTYQALTRCGTLFLRKEYVVSMSSSYDIFRTNLFNILSTQSQRFQHRPWIRQPHSLRERIVRFFIDHCLYPAGSKDFKIKMTQLGAEVNDSRLDVSRALNEMQAEGLLILSRNHIVIPAMERLIM